MVAPLLAAAGGTALRMGGARLLGSAAASGSARTAFAGRAAQFGGSALQQSAVRGHRQQQDHGVSNWVRQNPAEATVAGVGAAMRALSSPGLADAANSAFDSVISAQQFGTR